MNEISNYLKFHRIFQRIGKKYGFLWEKLSFEHIGVKVYIQQ